MASGQPIASWEARFAVGSSILDMESFDITATADDIVVRTFETLVNSVPYEGRIPGFLSCQINAKGFWSATANPHLSPPNLVAGASLSNVYGYVRKAGLRRFVIASLLLLSVKVSADTTGANKVMIEIGGKASGVFTYPVEFMGETDITKALALPVVATIKGTEWKISLPTKSIQGQFSLYLKSQARDSLKAVLDGQPVDVIAHALKELAVDFDAADPPRQVDGTTVTTGLRKYDFGSALCMQRIAEDLQSQIYLFWLMLRRYQPAVTVEEVWGLAQEDPLGFRVAFEAVAEAGKSNPQALLAP